ncbi:S8 family peptidase [Actinoplanes sp. NPDC026619]|uniref:S8 family peptidase n=1 Tax=Actinoplanes sp. NPDC026619 TaxID=3155798 RepID=UPI0033EE80CE
MRVLGTLLTAAAVTAAGSAVPAQAAVGNVIGAGASGAIPGQYIVTMKSASGLSAQRAGAAKSSYQARMSAVQARRLAARSDVAYVEQDRMVHAETTTYNGPVWGLDRIDQRPVKLSKTYTPGDDGSSVHAYVIDTGIRITHNEFSGRATYGFNFVNYNATASDCNGHGTHVAGTIGGKSYGVAKQVKLVAVKVLDCEGAGELSDVINGINWVTAHAQKPAVANLSLGGDKSPSLNAALQKLINSGVTVVVAAGNENVNAATESPSNLAAAITVGATNNKDQRASFSNFGSMVDLFAPGVGIKSAYASGDYSTAVADGTSMASPHVAGAAALVLDATPGYTPVQVRNYLVAHATTGKVSGLKGSPNRLLFVTAPPAAPVIRTSAIAMTAGAAYSGQLALTATRRGAWSLAEGTLPTGVTLNGNGLISGTPTGPGSATIKVRFTDYVPTAVTKTITVAMTVTSPVIRTAALPGIMRGTYYNQQLTADRSGTWALSDGDLPNGLSLDTDGEITGVATIAGLLTFTVAFTDGWGQTTRTELTIEVAERS